MAFESSAPLKKYKEEIEEKDKKIDELYKALGKTQIEKNWVLKKLIVTQQATFHLGGGNFFHPLKVLNL